MSSPVSAKLKKRKSDARRGIYRVSQKKLSFIELSISRFVIHIMSTSSQLEAGSPKAQFGKTQLFFETPCTFLVFLAHAHDRHCIYMMMGDIMTIKTCAQIALLT